MGIKSSCSQLLWMKHTLKEYNVEHEVMTLFCNKDSHAIDEVQIEITHKNKESDVIGLGEE